MRIGVLAASALATLALPHQAGAVVLVDSHGRPIGGLWQQWADRSRTPTYAGRVELTFGRCGTSGAWGCALTADTSPKGSPPAVNVDTHLTPYSRRRGTLYHELGHVYDIHGLAATDRVAFKAIWLTREAWWSTDGFAAGEWFAEGYRLCSMDRAWSAATATAESYSYYYPALWGSTSPSWAPLPPVPLAQVQMWALAAQNATCALIRNSAVRYWTRRPSGRERPRRSLAHL